MGHTDSESLVHTHMVSVIMAVHNGARYLEPSVDSILAQSMIDFEFIIVDDGSTDETPELLSKYSDARLRLLTNKARVGLTRSLNRAINLSETKYIARQDADDISTFNRLETQVSYMESHPNIGLVGSGAFWIDAEGEIIREWKPPTNSDELQRLLLTSIPFLHGTFIFRREAIRDIGGGYDATYPVAQDCDLLLRIADRWDVSNIPHLLYAHRRHNQSITAHRSAEQKAHERISQTRAVRRRLRLGVRQLLPRVERANRELPRQDRRLIARRYVLWSESARGITKFAAAQLLLVAILMDPLSPEVWTYIRGIVTRKLRLLRAWRTREPSALIK